MMLLYCILFSSYSKVSNLSNYLSQNPKIENEAIKITILRNRCQFLLLKLYFNDPQKPKSCSKTYCTNDVINCLKYTFLKSRSENPFQSIDESMTKFMGR